MEKCVIHIVSNREWGGGEQYVLDLARHQVADGYRVLVLCRPVEAVASRFGELGVLHGTLPLRGIADLKSALGLAGVVRKTTGTAVVHVHNFKDAFTAAYARRLARRPEVRLVLTRHLVRPAKCSLPYRWLYRQLDAMVFVSDLARSAFLSTRPRLPEGRTTVIRPAVVVPDDVSPVDLHGLFGLTADAVVAMYHGRLAPEKGLDTLVDAMALLRDCPLALILVGTGTDAYTARLRQRIAASGLEGRVHLAGFQRPVFPFVAGAGIGLVPSVVSESCSLAAQEYMSQGVPVVASDNGGQREYIRHDANGLLVPPGDPAALAAALRRLASDAGLRLRLGEQARVDFGAHLAYDRFYDAMRALYQ